MSLTHRVGVTYTTNAGQISATTNTYTGSGEAVVDESLAIGTNTLVNIAVDVSEIESLCIVSNAAMTIKTNSSGAPDDTITLVANVPVIWTTDSLEACPLTVDVTKIYCTQAALATLKIRVLTDATP